MHVKATGKILSSIRNFYINEIVVKLFEQGILRKIHYY